MNLKTFSFHVLLALMNALIIIEFSFDQDSINYVEVCHYYYLKSSQNYTPGKFFRTPPRTIDPIKLP